MKRLLSFFLAILFLASCQSDAPRDKGKPFVVTSIPPYISLVKAIVGDTMTVESAIGENFDPHASEVTPSQMKKVQDADLFIGVGEFYENKLLLAINQGVKRVSVLELDEKIPLLSFSDDTSFVDACHDAKLYVDGSKDLHFWLGPESLIMQVNVMVEALARLNHQNGDQYSQNAQKLIAKIRALDLDLQTQLRPFQKKAVIVSHPALGYFCHQYHLTQIAVECEGKEPLPKDVTNLLHYAKNADVICVFTAPQFNNKGAELIAKKLNLRVETFNPLAKDPLETIQQIADAITK